MAIRAGNYAKVAAAYAGIGESTFYEWLERGRKSRRGIYTEFTESVAQAEAEAQAGIVAAIRKEVPNDPRLGLDFLARRHPDLWGRRVQEHKIAIETPIPITIINADIEKLK